MTRQDIEREHTILDGIICGGKFEGEPVYAPYFWERGLNGLADHDDGEDFFFYVRDADRQLFPELGKAKIVSLTELDNGFIVTDTRL